MRKQIDIEQLKRIQLEIMDFFHAWCVEHGITYYMAGGTLIGALRHRGYIPWDDDIDLVLLRKDYDRLIADFPNSDTGFFRLHSIETNDSCIYTYAKIYDSRTVFIDGDDSNNDPIGVNIDIFPLENATDNYNDVIRLKRSIKLYDDILVVKQMSRKDRGIWKNLAISILKAISRLFSFKWLIKRVIKRATIYRQNTQSKYIANTVIFAKGENEILKREWFSSKVDLEFEGRRYYAPIGADQYLKRLFGDYMQMPPKEERVSHHQYKAFFKD